MEDGGSAHHWQSKAVPQQEVGEGSVLDDTEFYDDVGVSNYQVIGDYNKNHSYMDITSARYLEIGGRSSLLGSYDDIRSPEDPASSSRIYLSADNLSLVQYDDIKAREKVDDEAMCLEEDDEEELHSSALVTATPCVVLEEQTDSLNYVYDDIGRREEEEVGLYESIAGSLLNLARAGVSEDTEDFALGQRLARSMREPHEVVSYSLTIIITIIIIIIIIIITITVIITIIIITIIITIIAQVVSYSLNDSFRGSSKSSCTMERKSVTSESSEWVDIETGE